MLRLFIENVEIELDESVQFAVTKQFEDISNPTTIINSWSKSVSIPFTEKNNKTFGMIFSPDRQVSDLDSTGTGVKFNPIQKLDFRLQDGDNVLMQGYCKMTEIKQNNGKGTYEITLFGELGRVLQELSKLTVTDTNSEYFISSDTVGAPKAINRDEIYTQWSLFSLNPIKFAPNLAMNKDFDYGQRITGSQDLDSDTPNATYTSFKSTLDSRTINNQSFASYTRVNTDAVTKDGFSPLAFKEFRSYMQLPYIYVSTLFLMLEKYVNKESQIKGSVLEGYKIAKGDWFNTLYSGNDYFSYLAMTLRSLPLNEALSSYRGYTLTNSNIGTLPIRNYETPVRTNLTFVSNNDGNDFIENRLILDKQKDVHIALELDLGFGLDRDNDLRLSHSNGIIVELIVIGEKAGYTYRQGYLIKNSLYTNNVFGFTNKIVGEFEDTKTIPLRLVFDVSGNVLNSEKLGSYATFSILVYGVNNNDLVNINGKDISSNVTTSITNSTVNVSDYSTLGSGAKASLKEVWNDEYSFLDVILNYCRMFRIGVRVDTINKQIIFEPLVEYFKKYKVLDWSDKLHKELDFTIQPITFDNKYVLFNYDNTDVELGKQYLQETGVNYGSKRLVTDYNFDEKSTELFKGLKPSIVYSPTVMTWGNVYNGNVINTLVKNIFVNNVDKEGKEVDVFGQFYFQSKKQTFDSSISSVNISDDTLLQIEKGIPAYSNVLNVIQNIREVPLLDVISTVTTKDNEEVKLCCLFNTPTKNFTYDSTHYNDVVDIYTNIWENYIKERYNPQNKIVTCYVSLTPTEWANFEFNNFVKIDNQLYFVNKIYDYDFTDKPVKVDLITISDIKGYTDVNYHFYN